MISIDPPKGSWDCQGLYHISTQCFMNPKCVGCGEIHRSPQCPRKNSENFPNEEKIEKPPPICCNCGLVHPASYKGCKNFPVKTKFRKTYADMTKNVPDKQKTSKTENIPPKKKIAQNDPKRLPIEPVHLYQLEELNGSFVKLNKTNEKIKTELKTASFAELSEFFVKLYEKIVSEEDTARKKLTFMDGISKMPQS